MDYNPRHSGVKRLMRESKELADATEMYYAKPIDDNLFEWHFSVRGPRDSDFEGGVYHGRISLPHDYPMKPPSIYLLTPNGRFEVGKKICLSISGYHPETWRPSWSIRTALLALVGFMPTKGEGAIGSLDFTPKERRKLAQQSLNFKCPRCGDCKVSEFLLPPSEDCSKSDDLEEAKALAANPYKAPVKAEAHQDTSTNSEIKKTDSDGTVESSSSNVQLRVSPVEVSRSPDPGNGDSGSTVRVPTPGQQPQNQIRRQRPVRVRNEIQVVEDRGTVPLILSAFVLFIAIVGLVYRRINNDLLSTDDYRGNLN